MQEKKNCSVLQKFEEFQVHFNYLSDQCHTDFKKVFAYSVLQVYYLTKFIHKFWISSNVKEVASWLQHKYFSFRHKKM